MFQYSNESLLPINKNNTACDRSVLEKTKKNKKKQINLKNMLLKKTELKLKPCEAFEKKLAAKEFRTSQ